MRRPNTPLRGTPVWVLPALLLLLCACGEQAAPRPLWGTGTLETTEVVVASVVGGRITARPVTEGQVVTAGTVVALVDSSGLTEQRDLARVGLQRIDVERRQAQTALAGARDRLEDAERTRDRLQNLRATDAVPQAELDAAETAANLAKRQVDAAETALEVFPVQERQIRLQLASLNRQISECRIAAPITGTVLTTYMEPGEVTAPGKGILRLGDLEDLYVHIYLPATQVGRVDLGAAAEVRADSWPGERFTGRVVHIADEAEFTPKNVQTAEARADLVYAVKVAVPNPDGRLKIGLPVEVDLPGISPRP